MNKSMIDHLSKKALLMKVGIGLFIYMYLMN